MKLSTNELNIIPNYPGVYKFIDNKNSVLYVGKALNLYLRVNSYFKKDQKDRPHIIPMIPKIKVIEIIQTNNEIDALILESALIKKHLPPYNVDLKDDKSYGYIFISNKEEIPKVKIVRNISPEECKKGRLFGPYPSGSIIKRVYNYIRKIYSFCNCKSLKEEKLYYDIGLCPGPNIGKISKEEYKKQIGLIQKLLNGDINFHIKDIENQMKSEVKSMNYEKAAILRDKLNDLKYIKQKILADKCDDEFDYKEKQKEAYLNQLKELSKEIGTTNIKRIECYDISNLSDEIAYGSMAVMENGYILNNSNRIFKIKTIKKQNDYEMLKEVLSRRIKHINNDKDISLNKNPDLILIDGGKMQLSGLKDFFKKNNIIEKVIGITKGRKYKRKGYKLKDEFWVYSDRDIIQKRLKNSALLIRLRDESHRYAIKHLRIGKKNLYKIIKFNNIDGVGEKTIKKLIIKYGSFDNIKTKSFEEINNVIHNKRITKKIVNYFNAG